MKKANRKHIVTLSKGVVRTYNMPRSMQRHKGTLSVIAEKIWINNRPIARIQGAGTRKHYLPWSAVREQPCHYQT